MATTDAKPGFRLPWSADRTESGSAGDTPAPDTTSGDTPTPDAAARDAAPTDQENETAAMIDAAPAASDLPAGDDPVARLDPSPETAVADASAAAPAPRPAPTVPAAAPTTRKPNKFMADLTRAMQAAAETARGETLARLGSDAKAHIEEIHAVTATEATELRKQADDDVAAIREWSKAEIARIREETDERITHRKGRLEREIEAHAAEIEARIERVQARVTAFETEMADFFERLLAEEDPTRFASMAESLPEPPGFDMDTPYEPVGLIGDTVVADEPVDDLPAERAVVLEPWPETPAQAVADAASATEPTETQPAEDRAVATESLVDATGAAEIVEDGEATAATAATETTETTETDPRVAVLGLTPDFAAAEAEALAFSPDDVQVEDEIPVLPDDALAARLAGLVPEHEETAEPAVTTRLVVSGLVSVASIAGFKRHLSRVTGVQAVGVSSGPEGEFVFAVSHDPAISLKEAVATLPGFGARVTGESEGELSVSARDPETEG